VPSLLPEFQTSKTLAIGHQSDLFIRFPFGKNALPQLELLAMIAAMVPTALMATQIPPLMATSNSPT
jgi:hypothetical protein